MSDSPVRIHLTHPSNPVSGKGITSSFTILGSTWTTKSFLRFLMCIILVNAVIAGYYLFSPLPIQQIRQAARLVQDLTTRHPKVTDAVTFKVTSDETKTWEKLGSSKIHIQGLHNRSKSVQNLRSDKWNQRFPLKNFPTSTPGKRVYSSDITISPLKANFDTTRSTKVEAVKSNETEENVAAMYSLFELESRRDGRRKSYGGNLDDEDHPQFSNAFPRHTKPLGLLNWTRSSESFKHFQQIDDEEAWLYSAYYDDREAVIVRVFGITLRDLLGIIFCHFYDDQKQFLATEKGRMRALKDSHGARSSAMEILCPVDMQMQPKYVRVTFSKTSPSSSNQIAVRYPQALSRNFTICFPPFHSNFSQASQLVQTMELNRMLGAQFFFVYNFSMSAEVGEILQKYQSEGLATVLPWPLPNLESWYYGQVLAINDCIYRNRGLSRYVVVTDADEVVVPHIHSNWLTLLDNVVKHPWQRDDEFLDPDLKPVLDRFNAHLTEEGPEGSRRRRKNGKDVKARKQSNPFTLTKQESLISNLMSFKASHKFARNKDKFPSRSSGDPPSRQLLSLTGEDLEDEDIEDPDKFRFGSFSFRCAFFTVKTPDKAFMKEIEPFPFSQQERDLFSRLPKCPMLHLMRSDLIFEHGLRSKIIAKPELVLQCGIHKVIAHVEGHRTAYVEPEIAVLHHYRGYKVDTCNTVDVSMLRFKNLFYQSLKSAAVKFSSILLS